VFSGPVGTIPSAHTPYQRGPLVSVTLYYFPKSVEIMRLMAVIMVLMFCSSLFSGCIAGEKETSKETEEMDDGSKLIFSTNFRNPVFGGLLPTKLEPSQIAVFENIIYGHRELNYTEAEVPNKGGNWTHYFTCKIGRAHV
jgi:hypothetical protein